MLSQLRAALPRILGFLGIVLGGTAAVAAVIGALAGRSITHALATGYYVVGAGILVGSFILGSRGPWRSEVEEEVDPSMYRTRVRRRRRRATTEERAESRRSSFGLFLLGLALVLLGALIDPSRRAF